MNTLVVPRLGRAGLGNELFPALRAAEIAADRDGTLVAPRWFQLRVGPTLRGERDRRQYWRLFRPPTLEQRLLRRRAERWLRSGRPGDQEIVEVAGRTGYYGPFTRPGEWHRETLLGWARGGVVGPGRQRGPYVSIHVRLGDFRRAEPGARSVDSNNTSTPLHWYVEGVRALRSAGIDVPIVVSSDGRDAELQSLLKVPGVARSGARNALDEIILLSRAVGLMGSRSTFTSWGAFLGSVPMVVAPGGDAYHPHDLAWEAGAGVLPAGWLGRVSMERA